MEKLFKEKLEGTSVLRVLVFLGLIGALAGCHKRGEPSLDEKDLETPPKVHRLP